METTDLIYEQNKLDSVLKLIDRQLLALIETEAADRDSLMRARQEMWDDPTHIIRDMDDVIELTAQNLEVTRATDKYLMTETDIKNLRRMQNKPYFGRFDFTEDSGGALEAIYIGTSNLMGESSYEIYVYDWRAPICSAFYEFDLGSASYETPNGVQPIHIVLKRQYKFENGKLAYMYDTDSSMHDDILGQILSQNTSNKLKVIISSIQKEQNTAIRNPQNRYLLIYGPAGSGKTSVGLHRMAYILYHYRSSIKARDIVVISGNAIFNSYIANILPDLGENDVTRHVFIDLLAGAVKDTFTFENHIEQLKFLGRNDNSERTKAVRIKYTDDFLKFCVAYFKSYRFIVPELRYRDQIIYSKEAFQSFWDERQFSGYKANLSNLVEKLRQHYEEYFFTNKKSILNDIANDDDGTLSEQQVLYRYERLLERYITDAAETLRRINGIDCLMQLYDILALYAEKHNLPDTFTAQLTKSIDDKHFTYEDALLYFLVRVLMGEIEPLLNISHVLIDEAQDYNLIQLYILKNLYPKSFFTLLADVNQTVSDVTSITQYDDFELIFGGGLQRLCLNKSYRSSGPINALAFQILAKQDSRSIEGASYYDRGGKKPRYIVTDNIAGSITGIMEKLHDYNTIGIITGQEEDAVGIHRSLIGHMDAQLVIDPFNEISGGVVVLPLALAKGLEFDVVFLVNCFQDSGNEPADRRRAYLGCTRALHELYLLDHAPLPRCFSDCAAFMEIETN